MKLATTTGDFNIYANSQQECVNLIAKSPFEYLDYNFGADLERNDGAFSENWKAHLADVRRTAEEHGMKFVQSHSPMGKPIARGEYHQWFVDMNKRCIESCAILGIPNVVVHSGYEQDISKEECFDRNRDFFLELLPFAEQCGVNVLVENFNKMCIPGMYWIDNAPDLRAMIDYVDHPMFHAVWDAGHANMQDMPQDEALRIVGKHVYALHIQDNMGDQDSHVAPMFGTLNLDSVMHGLLDIGYKGYFTFEAGNVFLGSYWRRKYEKDQRLLNPSLELRLQAENLLYEIGKYALSAYDCFEE